MWDSDWYILHRGKVIEVHEGRFGTGVKDFVCRAKGLNYALWEVKTSKFFKQNELLGFISEMIPLDRSWGMITEEKLLAGS